MSKEFGQFCRLLRKRSGLTQIQFAHKAALSVRTVIYWETGEREPRAEEIAVALAVLCATPAERDRAYLSLTSTRGIQLARQQVRVPSVSGQRSHGLPDLGDLLAAMRLRAGWSREQLATQLEMKVSTIVGWERTEHLPGDELLARLCDLLHAAPEERAALMTRRLTARWRDGSGSDGSGSDRSGSYEGLTARIEEFHEDVNLRQTPLIDLRALALRRQVWSAARLGQGICHQQRYQQLAARVDTAHSAWLLYQERNEEAGQCINRALGLLGRDLVSCDFAAYLLNTASCWAMLNRGVDYDAAIQLIKRWASGITRPELNAQVNCDLGYYAAAGGYSEQACQYMQQAKNNILRATPKPELRRYYTFTLARVMAQARRFDDALQAMSNWCESTSRAMLFPEVIHAEILLQAGLRCEAHCMVQKVTCELERHPSPLIAKRVSLLTRQL